MLCRRHHTHIRRRRIRHEPGPDPAPQELQLQGLDLPVLSQRVQVRERGHLSDVLHRFEVVIQDYRSFMT